MRSSGRGCGGGPSPDIHGSVEWEGVVRSSSGKGGR